MGFRALYACRLFRGIPAQISRRTGMNHVFSTLKVLGFGFALFGVAAGVAYGQAISSNLVGTVLDASGAAVVNADMSATNIGTGVISNTKTGGTGTYRFENLPVGTYKVSAKATGFRTTTVEVELLL